MSFRKGWLGNVLRRFRRPEAEPEEDPRADELRQKLEESRAVVEEQHEEAASPEVPVDAATAPEPPVPAAEPEPEPESEPEPEPDDVEARRRAVHERARSAAEEMRGDGSS